MIWSRLLRLGDLPVVTRVQGGAVLFDLRALAEEEDETLAGAVHKASGNVNVNKTGENQDVTG
jgi:hypothetical protein